MLNESSMQVLRDPADRLWGHATSSTSPSSPKASRRRPRRGRSVTSAAASDRATCSADRNRSKRSPRNAPAQRDCREDQAPGGEVGDRWGCATQAARIR